MKSSDPDPSTHSTPLTWGEVSRSAVLRECTFPVLSSPDQVVTAVHLVADLDEIRLLRAGAVVVLAPPISGAAWAVSIALRHAWERNACAVICGLDPAVAQTTARLAERLSVSVGFSAGNLSALALSLSAVVNTPQAARDRKLVTLVSSIVRLDAVEEVVDALARSFHGVHVGLLMPSGAVAVGDLPDRPWPGPVVRVPLTRLGGGSELRSLVAVLEPHASAWGDTVLVALETAGAKIDALEARTQLDVARRTRVESWALSRLAGTVGPPASAHEPPGLDGPLPAQAREWGLDRPHTGMIMVSRDLSSNWQPGHEHDVSVALAAAWPGSELRPIPYGGGWAVWRRWGAEDFPEEVWVGLETDAADDEAMEAANQYHDEELLKLLGQEVSEAIDELNLGLDLVAGLGGLSTAIEGFRLSLRQAAIAARAARFVQRTTVASFAELGPRTFLGLVDPAVVHEVADHQLTPLQRDRESHALISTLAAYLDGGGSTAAAATAIGIHRNTVTARLERIRSLGVDLDDPDLRLSHHLAAHLLLLLSQP